MGDKAQKNCKEHIIIIITDCTTYYRLYKQAKNPWQNEYIPMKLKDYKI